MDNSKTPLPDEMGGIASHKSMDMDRNDQLIDLDNPMLHIIENNDVIDDSVGFSNSQVGGDAVQGVTPMHRQNVDESRLDEVLVEGHLDDTDYPDIVDIADREATEQSHSDDL